MSRKGYRPWLRWALGGAVAGAACVAILALAYRSLPDMVSEERLRRALSAHAATWSGGELRLPEGAEVSIARGPRMTVEDAEFRGAFGGAAWHLDVASLQATFRVLPLLQGRVEIETLLLETPRLRFVDRADAIAPPPRETQPPGPGRSPVGEVIVTGASVAYEGVEQRLGVDGIDLRMAAEPGSTAVLLTGSLPAGERRLNVQGRLEDPAAAFSGRGSQGRLALRGAATADDAGTPPPPPRADVPPAAAQGEVVSALRRIASAVGLTGLGPVVVEGRFSLTPRSLEIADATLSLGGALAQGDLAIALAGDAPPFELLGIVVGGAAAAWDDAVAAVDAGGWRDVPVSLAWLAPLDVALAARLQDGRLAGTEVEARRIRVDARGGRARLEVAAAGDLGRLQADLGLDAAPEGGAPRLTVEGRLDDVSLGDTGRLLLNLAPPPLVGPPQLPEGTLDAEFDVATSGETLGGMLTGIDGSLGTEIRDGTITGADLILTLEALAEGREFMTEQDGPLIPAAGRTAFDTVEAQVDFVPGSARLREFRVRGERYAIDMSGEADLDIGVMQGEGQAKLHEDALDTGDAVTLVDLPFGFGGTLAAPVVAAGVPRSNGDLAAEPAADGNAR